MRSCLSELWNVLQEDIVEVKRISWQSNDKDNNEKDTLTLKNHIISKVKIFYDDKKFKVKHLEVFYSVLNSDDHTICEAAQQAVNYADQCGLCVGCTQCARKFYETILLENRNERSLPIELSEYLENRSYIYYYLSAYKSVKEYRKIENTLICLKGFSSSTPAIYSATFANPCTGGGLYLNVEGYGIAIDPGIGFVESMHKQGIFIEDVDAVIVTHNHIDHNADVKMLSSLSHDINRYYKQQIKFYSRFFKGIQGKHHEIKWILDKGTRQNTEIDSEDVSEDLGDYKEQKEIVVQKESEIHIDMSVIETKHMTEGVSYGLKLAINVGDKGLKIGYTSDTAFFPELVSFFNDVDILIFNISDIYEKDVRGTKSKSSHLGYDGSTQLLTEISEGQFPKLAIASEFCCYNGDYRMRVMRKLVEQVNPKRNLHILPSEVGLKVSLMNYRIFCSRCKRSVDLETISVIAPEQEFGTIQYVCKGCQYDLKKGD